MLGRNEVKEQVKRVHGVSAQAREIAVTAHAGQVDKLGEDYIKHPERVASLAETVLQEGSQFLDGMKASDNKYPDQHAFTEELKATAWLHDVIEDTSVTAEDLQYFGIPVDVVDAVVLLTKQKGVPNDVYYQKVKKNLRARIVKLADMLDNTDPERMMKLPMEVRERLMAKYLKGFQVLQHSSRMELPVETY